jgi:tetratricopeptide (TPR) repeat protein
VAGLYTKAVDAFMKVYEVQPDSMPVTALQNVVAAHVELGDVREAVAVGRRVTQTHRDEASLWAVYGNALERSGNLDEALQAMSEVERIDPEYPQLYARQGMWLLGAERAADAVPYLQKAVQRGQDPDVMARQLLARANTNGVRQENFQYAIDLIKLAKESFEVSPTQLRELNFWHGFSVFTLASKIQEAQTPQAARQTLPMFEEAKRLLTAARGYERITNLDQYLENTDAFIAIQQAIIRRGGG